MWISGAEIGLLGVFGGEVVTWSIMAGWFRVFVVGLVEIGRNGLHHIE